MYLHLQSDLYMEVKGVFSGTSTSFLYKLYLYSIYMVYIYIYITYILVITVVISKQYSHRFICSLQTDVYSFVTSYLCFWYFSFTKKFSRHTILTSGNNGFQSWLKPNNQCSFPTWIYLGKRKVCPLKMVN